MLVLLARDLGEHRGPTVIPYLGYTFPRLCVSAYNRQQGAVLYCAFYQSIAIKGQRQPFNFRQYSQPHHLTAFIGKLMGTNIDMIGGITIMR